MEITAQPQDDVKIIALTGELDANNSGELRKWVNEFLNPPAGNVVLDFTTVDYMTSAGLRIVLDIMKLMKQHGLSLSICCPSEEIKEIFDISGFSSLIAIHRTMDACLKKDD